MYQSMGAMDLFTNGEFPDVAGTGKSTIAATIANWARKKGILGGSFCFAHNVAERSSPALVFPTLASQLSLDPTRVTNTHFMRHC